MDEDQQQISIDSTHSGTLGGAAKTSGKGQHKRKSKGCQCRGDCRNKRCGCNSLDQKCTVNCGCTSNCRNRIWPLNENPDDEMDETQQANNVKIKTEKCTPTKHSLNHDEADSDNENANKSNNTDDTYVTTKTTLNSTSYLTPKMAR